MKTTQKSNINTVRHSALLWWNKLSRGKQNHYERQVFGEGSWSEDNSLHEKDIIKMFQTYCAFKAGWRGIENVPPDELLEVLDARGNKALAYPTWYPFKITPSQTKVGRWSSEVVPCDPYWDGGWMIKCTGLENNIGTVIMWRTIRKEQK